MPDGSGQCVFSARKGSRPRQRRDAGPAKLRGAVANYVAAEATSRDRLLRIVSAGFGEPDS